MWWHVAHKKKYTISKDVDGYYIDIYGDLGLKFIWGI
jgi:hypothetical protein